MVTTADDQRDALLYSHSGQFSVVRQRQRDGETFR